MRLWKDSKGWHTISTFQIDVILALDKEIDVFLLLYYFGAYSIYLCQLGDIGFQEFNLPPVVCLFAFCDYDIGGIFIPTYEIDSRRDCVFDEFLDCESTNACCSTNWRLLVGASNMVLLGVQGSNAV